MTDINQAILDCWNAQSPRGRLRRHRKVDPNIRRAIAENLRDGWSKEDMAEAIVNFCAAVYNRDTVWGNNSKYSKAVQRWGLFEFLHRGCLDDEKGKRWVKFTDNNWRIDDWLTREAVQQKIKDRRLQEQGNEILREIVPRKSLEEMLDTELVEVYNKSDRFYRTIIEKIRPDILGLIKQKRIDYVNPKREQEIDLR